MPILRCKTGGETEMKSIRTLARRALLMLIAFCFIIPTIVVSARTREKLTVGMIVAENFTRIDETGYFSGYGYEYLHEIAKYTGWEYSYLWGTPKSNLEKLSNGKIDLFGPMIKTPETEERFAFPDYQCGISYTTLSVDDENAEFFGYNDMESINGRTIGMLTDLPENKPFLEYCEAQGITVFPEYFESHTAMYKALENKNVDMVLSTTLSETSGVRVIAKLIPEPFYFVTSKDNPHIIDELNKALKKIQIVTPQLEAELYQEYCSAKKFNPLSLSKSELDYIMANPVVRVVHDPKHFPVEAYDPETETCSGMTYEIFKKVQEDTGLKFEYIPTDSFADAFTVITEGKADIICGIVENYNLSDEYELYLATPYLNMECVLVKHNKVYQQDKLIIAMPEGHQIVNRHYLLRNYPGAKIVYYPSAMECINAVHESDADLTFVDRYSIEEALKEPSMNNLVIARRPNLDYKITAGIRKSLDPTLMTIINKALNNISEEELNEIITECTSVTDTDVTFSTLIYRNPVQAILILVTFFIIVLIVFSQIIRLRRKHAGQIERLAYYDSATDCWNSNKFTKEAEELLAKNPGRNLCSMQFRHKEIQIHKRQLRSPVRRRCT